MPEGGKSYPLPQNHGGGNKMPYKGKKMPYKGKKMPSGTKKPMNRGY